MAFARRGGGAHALPKDIRLVSLIWMTSRGLGGECERGRRRLPSPWVSLCSGSAEGVAQCPHSTSGHTSGGRPAALPSAVRFPRQARAVRLSERLLNENPDGSSGRSFSVGLSVGDVFFLRIKKYTSTFPDLETINKKNARKRRRTVCLAEARFPREAWLPRCLGPVWRVAPAPVAAWPG